MTFQKILDKYRQISFSERDKGSRFERLMQAYLKTDPKYAHLFHKVWLWNETTTLPQEPKITKAIKEELIRFMDYHPAARISRNLRSMLLEFMTDEGATEVMYLPDLLYDLAAFFDLLDVIKEEYEDK